MESGLMDEIKLAAYFQWECTTHAAALNHWYCAEDIACFFEIYGILDANKIQEIVKTGVQDMGYIEFVRNISFRIYTYTSEVDANADWFVSEKLINNCEWCRAITAVASAYRANKGKTGFAESLKSVTVKNHYKSK